MAVLHPHYITAGRYTSKIDRKLLAGIFETDSTGKILTGVLPPEDHFFVSGSGLTVSVSPGFAVIADSASQSSVSPGAYFCTIDASSETLTLASSPDGFCQIYAEVNETQVDVTYKSSTGGIATLTTATNHGFSVGQTVLITGVDSTFDGSYVLTTGTTDNVIKYEKSGSVSNIAVSPVGKASVPFAIKATAAGGNIPSGNVIELASVKVASGSISAVIDKRTYVAARGAVQLYRGTAVNADGATTGVGNTATTPSVGKGRLAYDLSTKNLQLYSGTGTTWLTIVDGITGHHDSKAASTNGSIHHNLGTGQYDAAAGNHTHAKSETNINFTATSNCYIADNALSTPIASGSTTPTTVATITYDYPAGFSGNLVCLITGNITFDWALASATYFTNQTIVYAGVDVDAYSTGDDIPYATYSSASNVTGKGTTSTTGIDNVSRITVPFMRVVDFSIGGTHTISLKAYRNNTDCVVKAVQYQMSVVPIRAY
jgi:hypothetical protein